MAWAMGITVRVGLALTAALAWVVVVAGCGGDAAQTGTIMGYVSLDGSAAPGAAVVLHQEGDASAPTRTTVTDANGLFTFADLPFATYGLTASLEGFGGVLAGVAVTTSQPVGGHVELGPAGTIAGRFTLGSATGNAGILVTLAGTSLVTTTADDGAYTLSRVPIGAGYTVMASFQGYAVGPSPA
jgi:hypothetical protein